MAHTMGCGLPEYNTYSVQFTTCAKGYLQEGELCLRDGQGWR